MAIRCFLFACDRMMTLDVTSALVRGKLPSRKGLFDIGPSESHHSMLKSSTFLHVLVMGASSSYNSPGRIPTIEDVKPFQLLHPDYTVYFYFIDPGHRSNAADILMFHQLMDADIPLCVVPRVFDPSKFAEEYKIMPDDKVLFVDYSGLADSEKEWKNLIGDDRRWLFYIPHMMGSPTLNMERALETAYASQYTISSSCAVPRGLTAKQKASLIEELEPLITYARLLPSSSDPKEVPKWLKDRDSLVRDSSTDELFMIQASAESALCSFFSHNGVRIYAVRDASWFATAKRLIENA